jgi:hypothetical protein
MAVGYVGSINTVSGPRGSDKQRLSDKIMILQHKPIQCFKYVLHIQLNILSYQLTRLVNMSP